MPKLLCCDCSQPVLATRQTFGAGNVCFWGKSKRGAERTSMSAYDPKQSL